MDVKVLSKYVLGWGLAIILFFFIGLMDVDSKDNPGSNENYTPYKSNYALVIGIGKYDNKGWGNHSKSYEDCSLVKKQFENMGFEVEYCIDPGFSELNDRLNRFFNNKNIGKNSGLFIWYSGEGQTIESEGFLVPSDAPLKGTFDIKTKLFSVRRFEELCRNTKAKYVYMVFDSCLSSTVFINESNDSPTIPVASLPKYPARQSLFSCTTDQQVRNDSSFRGMFIKVLRNEVNADANGDNYLTASEIGKFIKTKLKNTQFRKLNGFDQGEFVFKFQIEFPYYFSDVFLNEKNEGPIMSRIPGGYFMMGDLQGLGYSDEKPKHGVNVTGIAVSRREITIAQYKLFCKKKGYKIPKEIENKPDYNPVIFVSWEDAVEYAKWLSEKTGFIYRLPTEAEWEYFARAGTDTNYWWGNEIGVGNANCIDCGAQRSGDEEMKTAPEEAFKPNPFGIYDTVGSVWEWTCSEYTDEYNGKETERLEKITTGAEVLVLRGGSWDDESKKCRASHRKAGYPGERSPYIGFRVVRELK